MEAPRARGEAEDTGLDHDAHGTMCPYHNLGTLLRVALLSTLVVDTQVGIRAVWRTGPNRGDVGGGRCGARHQRAGNGLHGTRQHSARDDFHVAPRAGGRGGHHSRVGLDSLARPQKAILFGGDGGKGAGRHCASSYGVTSDTRWGPGVGSGGGRTAG